MFENRIKRGDVVHLPSDTTKMTVVHVERGRVNVVWLDLDLHAQYAALSEDILVKEKVDG